MKIYRNSNSRTMASSRKEESAAASESSLLENIRKSAVPPDRQPGVSLRKRVVCNETEWDRVLDQLKKAMGEYKILGFDVECINTMNPRQFNQFQLFRGAITGSTFRPAPRHPQQNGHHPSSPSANGSSAGDGPNGIDDHTYYAQPQQLQMAVLPTPQGVKRHKEISVLVQLATWSGLVVILRLCYWRSIPQSLREFLADRQYIKLGVGIDQDAIRLLDDWNLVVKGWIDLRHLCVDLCVQFREYGQIRQMGLKKLAEGLFGSTVIAAAMPIGLKRMQSIASSDWNAVRLRCDQIKYAAWDAQIAVDIFSLATQRLYKIDAPKLGDRAYFETLYRRIDMFIDVPPSRHPRRRGEDDDYFEDDLCGGEEELNELYDNYRIQAQQAGNRGFSTSPGSPSGYLAEPASSPRMPITEEESTPAIASPVQQEVQPAIVNGGTESNAAIPAALERLFKCSVNVTSVDKKRGVVVLTINNDPMNIMDRDTIMYLTQQLQLFQESKDFRAVIITSGSNVFSGGYDLKEFRNADPKRLRNYLKAVHELWFQLYKSRLITVAAINGMAGIGGFIMAACCDRRIMAAGCGAVGFDEVKLGIIPPIWIVFRIVQLIGSHKAECIVSLGQMLEANTALENGLVDRVTSKDRLLKAANDDLDKLLAVPEYSRVAMKMMIRHQLIDKIWRERERYLELLTANILDPTTQDLLRRVAE